MLPLLTLFSYLTYKYVCFQIYLSFSAQIRQYKHETTTHFMQEGNVALTAVHEAKSFSSLDVVCKAQIVLLSRCFQFAICLNAIGHSQVILIMSLQSLMRSCVFAKNRTVCELYS